ncbi:hypothetical protein NFI96_020670 [Prochilodus magdalenae]|nr:hypothetical protein NFI96_020670 [Prochilodus magdalenae]
MIQHFIFCRRLAASIEVIQARRLVSWAQNNSATPTPTSVCSSPVSTCSTPSAASPSTASTTSTSSSPGGSTSFQPDWADNLQIPWQKLPEELLQSLERQKRHSPRLRREIRIVVSEMMKVCNNPTKRNTTEKRMVAKYPKPLQNVFEGDVGSGYHSLVRQLQARVEKVKPPNTPKIKKHKPASNGSDTEDIPAEQKASVQDTYGCVNWELKYLPGLRGLWIVREKKRKDDCLKR